MRTNVALITSLLMGMAPSIVAKGAKKRISVIDDGNKFNVDRFYDGRGKPYRIVFWEDGRNIFYFNESGQLKTIKKREEIYSVSEIAFVSFGGSVLADYFWGESLSTVFTVGENVFFYCISFSSSEKIRPWCVVVMLDHSIVLR